MKIERPPQNLSSTTQMDKPAKKEDEQLRQVAKGFEAVFVNQLVGAMRKTVVKGGMIPESNAERTWQAMLDHEYATKVSDSGQLGIAQMVYDHLLRKSGGR